MKTKRKKGKHYTDIQKKWIKDTVKNKKVTNKELTKLFNEKFNDNRSHRSIATLRNRLGVNTRRVYTNEHIEFLRKKAKIKGITNKQITKLFNEQFKDNRTANSIANIRSEHNIVLNNKHALYMSGRNHRGSRPIGYERVRKGYVEVKVEQPNKWEQKQRYIWEKYNRPLKDDEVVIFLDGNNRNFDLDNLEVVKRKYLGRMNYNNYITENKELTKAGLNVVKLVSKVREMERED